MKFTGKAAIVTGAAFCAGVILSGDGEMIIELFGNFSF
jgi:hypothetical protein